MNRQIECFNKSLEKDFFTFFSKVDHNKVIKITLIIFNVILPFDFVETKVTVKYSSSEERYADCYILIKEYKMERPTEVMFPCFKQPEDGQGSVSSTSKTEDLTDTSLSQSEVSDLPKVSPSILKFSIDSILNRKDPDLGQEKKIKMESVVSKEFCTQLNSTADPLDEESQKFSWMHCTRYKPPQLQRIKKKDGFKKRKLGRNPRVPFTQHQVAALEQKFRQTHYLSSMDVAELSAALSLTETRVKIWFQNRRARERRYKEAKQKDQFDYKKSVSSLTLPGNSWTFQIPPSSSVSNTFHEAHRIGKSAFSPVHFHTNFNTN